MVNEPVAPPTTDTRTALLSAAERLFLADGYDKVSVRAICAAADANAAAVHYHFGSKTDLTVALLQDRLGPLWRDPLATLQPGIDPIDRVVDVVLRPLVDLHHDPLGHLHLQLLCRFVLAHPNADWTGTWFRLEPWADFLTATVPGLTSSAAARRWSLAFELMLVGFGGPEQQPPAAITALTDFVVAGLSASASTSPTPEEI
ncbi:TetR/AcrR family transcriptional regulator [Gordonia sp. CPCC 205515]|uniref:TetR/AcrR family transcriptional regulator n=1 Tax=Gordonia sp. CPCC 205515 TaxID=3140791 RepID=UPI003AF3A36A